MAFTATAGQFTLDYAPNTYGNAELTVRVMDSGGLFVQTTFTVTVTPVNDLPTAINDVAVVLKNSSNNPIPVLSNDTGAPDSGETLSIIAKTKGTNGTVTFTATGLTYTPTPGYFGPDSFTYTDGTLGSNSTAMVTVSVVPMELAANGDLFTVSEESGATPLAVLANDTGVSLSITGVTNGVNGTVAITGGGTDLTYQPNANFSGIDGFTYTITDAGSNTATATGQHLACRNVANPSGHEGWVASTSRCWTYGPPSATVAGGCSEGGKRFSGRSQ